MDEKIREFVAESISYGDSFGRGCVDSFGYGYGDGYGFGSGDGDSDGDGYGFGDGYGDGYGFGDGYGDGYGFGDGDAIKSINGHEVFQIDEINTIIFEVNHENFAKGAILQADLTLAPCCIAKHGALYAHGETWLKAIRALQEKQFENMPLIERIDAFVAEIKPGIVYPTKVFFDWHNRLTGSCEAGRLAFARDHEIDLTNGHMTLGEFFNLTRDAYGGEIIKQAEAELQKRMEAALKREFEQALANDDGTAVNDELISKAWQEFYQK